MPPGDRETELGAGGREFLPTAWTRIQQARDAETTEARRAWDQLVALYWKPVYFHVRRKGFPVEDAVGSRPAAEFRLAESGNRSGLYPTLSPGEACGFLEDALDERWEAGSAGAPDQRLHPSGLPPGKYRLTAIYRSEGRAGFWQGTVTTGPVEIEIVAPVPVRPAGPVGH
jgi:hypothetical protein